MEANLERFGTQPEAILEPFGSQLGAILEPNLASTQLGFNPPATGHQPTVSDDLRRVGTREAYRISLSTGATQKVL